MGEAESRGSVAGSGARAETRAGGGAGREKAMAALREHGVAFELIEHPAVYTMDEMHALGITGMGDVCKNLFLRDAKGKNHFLVTMAEDKRADLKSIAAQLGCGALSFGSESRLMEHLGLERGAVTPLGIVNSRSPSVTLVFDEGLAGRERLGVHPCDNTATVWVSFEGLQKLARELGVKTRQVRL